jgi:hypothetical protein
MSSWPNLPIEVLNVPLAPTMLYLRAMTKHELPTDPFSPRCLAAEPKAFGLADLAQRLAVQRRFQARAGLEVLLWRMDVEQKT